MYMCVYMYVYIYVRICISICVCIFMCMCVHAISMHSIVVIYIVFCILSYFALYFGICAERNYLRILVSVHSITVRASSDLYCAKHLMAYVRCLYVHGLCFFTHVHVACHVLGRLGFSSSDKTSLFSRACPHPWDEIKLN